MSGLRDIHIGGLGSAAGKQELSDLPDPATQDAAQPRQQGQQRSRARSQSKAQANTQKELQKLRRVDLLELLVDQIRENEQLSESVAELTDLSERLKDRLNQKDAQIEHLKDRLNQKDAEIERMHEQSAEIAHAKGMLDIHELLEVERRAVESYLKQVTAQDAERSSLRATTAASTSSNSAAAASEIARRSFAASQASAAGTSAGNALHRADTTYTHAKHTK